MGELLGTGGFGRVNKAVWRGTDVAVKTMSAAYSPERHSAFIEEVPASHTLASLFRCGPSRTGFDSPLPRWAPGEDNDGTEAPARGPVHGGSDQAAQSVHRCVRVEAVQSLKLQRSGAH